KRKDKQTDRIVIAVHLADHLDRKKIQVNLPKLKPGRVLQAARSAPFKKTRRKLKVTTSPTGGVQLSVCTRVYDDKHERWRTSERTNHRPRTFYICLQVQRASSG